MTLEMKYKKKLDDVIKHSFLSIVDFCTETKEIEFIVSPKSNKNFKLISSYYDEIVRYSKENFLHPDDINVFDEVVQTENLEQLIKQTNKDCYSFVFRSKLEPEDKDYCWIKCRLLILEKEKRGFHILASFEDVSEFKKKEMRQVQVNTYRMMALKNAFEELYIINLKNNKFYSFNINDVNEIRHPEGSFRYCDVNRMIHKHVHCEERNEVLKYMHGDYIKKEFAKGKRNLSFEFRFCDSEDADNYHWMWANILQLEDDRYPESAFVLIKDITEKKEAADLRAQYRLIKKQLEMQIHHYEYVKEKEEELKAFRHDMKNHLLILEGMHDNKNNEEFHKYIANMRGFLMNSICFIDTGNAILDVLINEKLSYAKSMNININHHIRIVPNLPLSTMDTVELFGNALDNAIQACEHVEKEKEKIIDFKVVYLHNTLVLKVLNTVSSTVKNNPSFKTIKKNKELHGLGLRNIKNVVSKHDGLFDLNIIDGKAMLQVTLYL